MCMSLQRRQLLCENVAVAAAPFAIVRECSCGGSEYCSGCSAVNCFVELRRGCSTGGGFVKVLLLWLIMMLWLQRREFVL